MQHTIPVSATFTLFKYINVTPSFNYTERWYLNKVKQSYDPTARDKVKRDTIAGFNRVYNYNLSLQMNTKLYGFFKPWKMFGDKVEMIRRVFTPSVSFSLSHRPSSRLQSVHPFRLSYITTTGSPLNAVCRL